MTGMKKHTQTIAVLLFFSKHTKGFSQKNLTNLIKKKCGTLISTRVQIQL
jgi:hypothetical protein